jgi:hypothetical protein
VAVKIAPVKLIVLGNCNEGNEKEPGPRSPRKKVWEDKPRRVRLVLKKLKPVETGKSGGREFTPVRLLMVN